MGSPVIPDSVFDFIIMDIEGGGKVHDRGWQDPGGVTKYGFAQRHNPDIDVSTLTEAQAKVRATEKYWKPSRAYEFQPGLALMHFDCSFLDGAGTAARTLQAACGTKVDGSIGPTTIRVANEWDQLALLERYAMLRKQRWLGFNNAVEEANENGWLNRLIRVLMRAVRAQVGA